MTISGNDLTFENRSSDANGGILWNIPVSVGENITISYENMIETNTSSNNRIQYWFSDTLVTSISSTGTGTSVDKTTKKATNISATKKYLVVMFRTSNSNSYTITNVQVEYGTDKTGYIRHAEKNYPITLPTGMELCKIGTYQDYIYKSGENWYKHSAIGKVVLDGTESGWNTASTGNHGYGIKNYVEAYRTNDEILWYCNYFKGIAYNDRYVDGTTFIGVNDNNIIFCDYSVSDLAGFKTWVSTHNIVFYYVLATPTDVLITDTTLINQLNQIENAAGYDGITYITTTNENDLAIIPVFFYNKVSEGIRVSRNRTRIIVQRKKKPDITLELEIGALELVKVTDEYQDTIYKENDKWYISKKTAKISSYAGESISTPYISSKTTLETGALVYYGISESITEITDTDLIEQLDSILDIELDREETSFEQEVDRFDLKMILYIKAYERKVELEIKEVDRIIGFVDNLEAIKQAVYHILMTERYAYLIYDNNYGVELDQYIGRGFDYLESGIEQTLREALLQDLRITNVFVTDIIKNSDDSAHIYFEVQSIYGNLQMEVNVNV